jgi:signal transduction histidine kinase
MFGGGLGQLKAGRLRQFRKSDGLSSDFVQCLLPGGDGALWIGTSDGGLNRLKDGQFAAIGMRQGLPNNVICHLVEDRRGFFWIGSHGGILRVAKAELDRCAEGEISAVSGLVYGRGDGMPTLECAGGLQPAGTQTADGRLWFSTSKGLVAVDPENVTTNQLAPPVVIEELRVDDQILDSGCPTGTPRRIPPGRQRFEIRYTGLSFSAPERVLFKYRLQGLEKQWTEAGTRRVAAYSYLPPGDYVFRVIACNNDGVWNLTGASRAFTVLPHVWQTLWFRSLAGGGVAAVVGLAMLWTARRKLRRHIERVERQQAIERERARIAQDIHDDLGASLTRISLLSQTARAELDNPRQAAANLDRIYSTARELTRAMDEIVWAVNPRHDTLDSLASYLGRFAQDFLGTAGLRCRLDVPVRLPAWPLTAEIRHNLFLAFKEALHNVLKHAAAKQVSISLVLSPNAFVVTVEDDGQGFALAEAVAAPEPRGNGIRNMSRRLTDIGGRCEIESEPGKGTRLSFHVPVTLASE